MKKSTKEEVRLLKSLIFELHRQFKDDPTVFRSSVYRSREEVTVMDGETEKAVEVLEMSITTIDITFQPSNNTNHNCKYIDFMTLRWVPQISEIDLDMRYESPNKGTLTGSNSRDNSRFRRKFTLGENATFNGENGETKKQLHMLLKSIRNYEEVLLPKIDNEKFEQAIYEAFPGLLDHLILGENSENKKV